MTDAATGLPPVHADDAADAVREAAELLWPAPASVQVQSRKDLPPPGSTVIGEHLLLPSRSRPRLVVPTGAPRAGAVAAGRLGETRLVKRLASKALASSVRWGFADRLHPHRLRVTAPAGASVDTIETELASLLGRRVLVSLSVGTARVNRKPILQMFAPDGTTLGFVKVGHTASTAALVRTEAANLRRLAEHDLHLIEVPDVLHHTEWRGVDLLVLSAVGDERRRGNRDRTPYAAMRELATVGQTRQLLTDSTLHARLTALPGLLRDRRTTERVDGALQRILGAGATTELRVGAWHGDWTPWNMTWLAGSDERVGLWDWERFGTDLPVGFDAAHYRLQTLLLQHGAGDRVGAEFLRESDAVVASGGADRDSATLVVALYAAELAARYLTLAQEPDGAPLARRAAWVVDFLESCAARL